MQPYASLYAVALCQLYTSLYAVTLCRRSQQLGMLQGLAYTVLCCVIPMRGMFRTSLYAAFMRFFG